MVSEEYKVLASKALKFTQAKNKALIIVFLLFLGLPVYLYFKSDGVMLELSSIIALIFLLTSGYFLIKHAKIKKIAPTFLNHPEKFSEVTAKERTGRYGAKSYHLHLKTKAGKTYRIFGESEDILNLVKEFEHIF